MADYGAAETIGYGTTPLRDRVAALTGRAVITI
jgi:hypothetical protein